MRDEIRRLGTPAPPYILWRGRVTRKISYLVLQYLIVSLRCTPTSAVCRTPWSCGLGHLWWCGTCLVLWIPGVISPIASPRASCIFWATPSWACPSYPTCCWSSGTGVQPVWLGAELLKRVSEQLNRRPSSWTGVRAVELSSELLSEQFNCEQAQTYSKLRFARRM